MLVKVVDNPRWIAEAINGFPQVYHDDFAACRLIGERYLSEPVPEDDLVASLVNSLRRALKSWGVGKRKAPEMRTKGDFAVV